MKKLFDVCITVSLFLIVAAMCIGYAAISDTLSVTGQASAAGKPYKGVYIKSVTLVSGTNVNVTDYDYILPTNHEVSADAGYSGGSVTYRITVHNNTDVTYWYVGQRFDTTFEENGLIGTNNGITIRTTDRIGDSDSTFNSDDWVPPQTERDFYVTYTYGSNAQNPCDTLVNFHFDIRMDAVHDEFLAVLNNVKAPDSYQYLVNAFDTEYSKTGKNIITTESHPEIFANLFEDLMVNIDGQERKASVVIRRENLDNDTTTGDNGSGDTGCEYTLYITVEPLTPGTKPTVYAIAYSEGAKAMGDDWYQVGELYEGTAQVKSDGTIDYANWVASHKTYEMADGIEYIVGQVGHGDQYDLMYKMEQLISAEDQDIFNLIDNTKIFKKVYDIIQSHRGSNDPAVEGLRAAFEEASKFYINHNNGQEFKVVRNTYTRAEIIYAIKNIQRALDYYYEVFNN